MGSLRARTTLAFAAVSAVTTACALVSGVGDLTVGAPGAPDADAGIAGGGGGDAAGAGVDPGADASSQGTDGAVVDAANDAAVVTFPRLVTFEDGSLTGPLGVDSLIGGVTLVSGGDALVGDYSMRVDAAGELGVVNLGVPEVWVDFQAKLDDVGGSGSLTFLSITLDGGHEVVVAFDAPDTIRLVSDGALAASSGGAFDSNHAALTVHLKQGAGNAIVEVTIGTSSSPDVSFGTLTFTKVVDMRFGAVATTFGSFHATFDQIDAKLAP